MLRVCPHPVDKPSTFGSADLGVFEIFGGVEAMHLKDESAIEVRMALRRAVLLLIFEVAEPTRLNLRGEDVEFSDHESVSTDRESVHGLRHPVAGERVHLGGDLGESAANEFRNESRCEFFLRGWSGYQRGIDDVCHVGIRTDTAKPVK